MPSAESRQGVYENNDSTDVKDRFWSQKIHTHHERTALRTASFSSTPAFQHARPDTSTHIVTTGTRLDTRRRAPQQRRRTPHPSGLPFLKKPTKQKTASSTCASTTGSFTPTLTAMTARRSHAAAPRSSGERWTPHMSKPPSRAIAWRANQPFSPSLRFRGSFEYEQRREGCRGGSL